MRLKTEIRLPPPPPPPPSPVNTILLFCHAETANSCQGRENYIKAGVNPEWDIRFHSTSTVNSGRRTLAGRFGDSLPPDWWYGAPVTRPHLTHSPRIVDQKQECRPPLVSIVSDWQIIGRNDEIIELPTIQQYTSQNYHQQLVSQSHTWSLSHSSKTSEWRQVSSEWSWRCWHL